MQLGKILEHTGKGAGQRFLHKPVIHFIVIAVIGLAAYSNTFHMPFVFDDENSITDNPVIRSLDNFLSNSTGYYYKPSRFIGYLTFALNYRLGGLDVTGYHAFNLGVHLINALLVYCLVRLTLKTPFFEVSGIKFQVSGPPTSNLKLETLNLVPLLAALLFVAHPIQTQAVTYIVQRLASLVTMFYLLAIVLYAWMRLTRESAGSSRTKTAMLYLFSLVAMVLAMKTKEIAITLPLVVLLYEFSFFRGGPLKRLAMLVPVLATFFVIPQTLLNASKPMGELLSDVSTVTTVHLDTTRWDYLLTQFSVITTYIRLLFLPVNQNLDYDYPIYHTLFTPRVLLSFLFLMALFGLAVYLYYRSTTSHQPPATSHQLRLIAFGIFWFFIALAVESSVIPIGDVIFEHRVYLPSFGAFVAFAVAFVMIFERYSGAVDRKVPVLAAALIVLALVIATWQRNLVWRDPVTLWEDCFRKSPGKARVNYNLGTQLASQGRVEEAITFFQRAIQQRPNSQEYNNLGSAYQRKGLIDRAIEMYTRAIALQRDNAEAYYNLGTAYLTLEGKDADAVNLFLKAIEYKPDYNDAFINLAAAYNKMGRFRDAVALLEGRKGPLQGRADARFNLGVAYHCLGNSGEAARELAELKSLEPGTAARLEAFLSKPYASAASHRGQD